MKNYFGIEIDNCQNVKFRGNLKQYTYIVTKEIQNKHK